MIDLDSNDEPGLARYDHALGCLREQVGTKILEGRNLELSSLTDRMALSGPHHCEAGLDHLTLDPAGYLWTCPGFIGKGDPIGSLQKRASIPNGYLLRLAHAPICGVCDAFHCRRCVFLNQRATLEVNTPPWQVCRAAHYEREHARLLLEELQRRGRFRNLPPIRAIAHNDPLELLLDRKLPRPFRTRVPQDDDGPAPPPPLSRSNVRTAVLQSAGFAPCAAPSLGSPRMKEAATGGCPDEPSDLPSRGRAGAPIGKVTVAERDAARDLYRRKHALRALLAMPDLSHENRAHLRDRIMADIVQVDEALRAWWNDTSSKHGWRHTPDSTWRIDFGTRQVYVE